MYLGLYFKSTLNPAFQKKLGATKSLNKQVYEKKPTYFDDKKFWNRALMRSRPCLTLRKLRERLPAVLTELYRVS